MFRKMFILLLAACGFSTVHVIAQAQLPASMANKVEHLSGLPSRLAAKQLGISTLHGKSVAPGNFGPPGNAQFPKLTDVPVAATSNSEDEPSVVANPVNKQFLVASSHLYPPFNFQQFGVSCVAYASSDGGASWNSGVIMQQLDPSSICSDPVLAYAPDGSRVYMAYMDILVSTTFNILVSHSDDNGLTWSAPVIALQGNPAAYLYDKPWIATHSFDAAQSQFVYVTATQFNFSGPDHIAFSRSADKGLTFNSTSPTLFDSASFPVAVQGSHPAAGPGADVLVAWYNSGPDGALNGGFQIKVAHSADNGATFGAPVVAASETCCELPYGLGPYGFYHIWWTGMFPSTAIDGKGGAHIAYAYSPVDQNLNPGSTHSGDIRYITSTGAPYDAWSAPITVNDDGLPRGHGFPAVAADKDGTVWLSWEDHRLSPDVPAVFPNSSNLYYDTFVARKAPGQNAFFANLRASDKSSMSQFLFVGDYTGIALIPGALYSIWTDRRNRTTILDGNNDVFGSRVISGGGTP
ncbi:exo-alpha-sialidase [Burkholderia sp. Bp8963]|uniref:sialidase family protein n=1 Tax=Burkholderia sp. Bp8963 TaxID=2184547 RepID=UPI000F5B75C8|nr:sialidase family protein [Burkholderia sp. Bp8963]RQS60055.1 exo-alpha-sialidase [Burkholderia sp. Bp8963]